MDCNALESLFLSNVSEGIEQSQKMICSLSNFDSFQDFISYHLKNAHFYYCPKPFSAKIIPQLSIYCIDCAKNDNLSLICLPCFLNGNHEGHNYFIFPGFMGNCDCGDKCHLKSEGFCSKHQGLEDDNNIDNYLDENLKSVLTNTIFKSSFKALLHLQQTDTKKSAEISKFIISFFNLGDGFRRLFVKTIAQDDLLNTLIYNVQGSPSTEILTIFSYLMHDQLFVRNLSKSVVTYVFDKAIKNSSEEMLKQPTTSNYSTWHEFIYTCFSDHFFRYNIENNGWDWITFSIELLGQYKKLLFLFKDYKYKTYPLVFMIIKCIHYATSIQPNKETQEFFDKMFTQVFNTGVNDANDTIIVESYKKFSISTQIDSYLDFIKTFGDLMISFKSKENLKLDKLIEELDKLIDISPLYLISKNSVGNDDGKNNENDKLISRFIIKKDESKSLYSIFKSKVKSIFRSFPSKYYKSFYNGASFFICHPLYDSFSMLFRVDDLCRIKIARFLCQEKFQQLRVKLGIITLKKILSVVCFKMGLVRMKNLTILILFDKIFNDKTEIIYNLMPISVFQLLIGLQCTDKIRSKCIVDEFILKEFFSFELAREIGIFEDNNANKKELLVFTFLYVSLMIVIDRNLINYDYKKVLEEQIVFALKKGVHSIDELHDILNTNLDNPKEYFTLFNEILMKVAKNYTNDEIIENENDTNITLQSFSDVKISDDDYEDEYDDNEDVKDKLNLMKINQKDVKKENHNIKPINFYLKEGIECNAISAVNPINDQRSYLNIEISKNSHKLLKLQEFESEETSFFNKDGLNIHLKQFLQTPTMLAIVYDTLRSNFENDPLNAGLNDHLSMNILILISRFIKEESENLIHITSKVNSKEIIQYHSIPDLISKLKRSVFNHHSSGNETEDFIENTLNQTNFISLLTLKFEPENLQPKSIIDILINKGQLGQEVLHQISKNVHIDFIDETKNEDLNAVQKNKAKKIKEDILNQFSNMRNHYHFSESFESISQSNSFFMSSLNKEVCSFCSETKKEEILCYPLYIYRTKFPFIVDKPPFVISEKVNDISVYDNEDDFSIDIDIDEYVRKELGIKEKETNEDKIKKYQQIKEILLNIMKQRQKEKEEFGIETEKMKRVTFGANFIIQYGICPHPFHRSCVKEDEFICPIDRSKKNGFLPYLDEISKNVIFKDLKTFELNSSCEKKSLSSNIVESITSFIDKFQSFFSTNIKSFNIFVELIKSISGLIETYEIRLRNLPDSLDSTKTKILSRNLFLTVWYAYRIQKKPQFKNEEEIKSRLTDFQKFIKNLIEFDDIDSTNISNDVNQMIEHSIKSGKMEDKEINLFLRRVCLSEYFLLNVNVNNNSDDGFDNELIEWDEILSTENLSRRYCFLFKSNYEFKPFLFTNFPKEFLRLSQNPFNLPISDVLNLSMFNILDYNYLIKYYEEIKDNKEKTEEIKRYCRSIYFCDLEYLPFVLNFIGKMNYPSVLMFTGSLSSQIFLVDQTQGASLDTPYVDKSGCPDIKHVRMQPLFLNEERYEKLIDQILSGDFSYKLNSIEHKENLFNQEIQSSDLF